MNKFFCSILVFSIFFTSKNSLGDTLDKCILDSYFNNFYLYKKNKIEQKKNELEKQENFLSLLPSISINSSQHSTNDNGFNWISKSSFGISLSQNIYSGGNYLKNKEKIMLIDKLNEANMMQDKINYLLDIVRAISDYNYYLDQVNIYSKRIGFQKKLISKHIALYNGGKISKLDLDIGHMKLKELETSMLKLKNDISFFEKIMINQYGINKQEINKIKLDDIKSCKITNIHDLLLDKYMLEKKISRLDYKIYQSSLQPSFDISISLEPTNDGYIRSINTKKADYNISVGVSYPLSNLFSRSLYDKKNEIEMKSIDINNENNIIMYNNDKINIQKEIITLSYDIDFLKKDIDLKKKNLEYIYSRYLDNKETITYYYEQLESYELSELNIKKKERELDYYQIYSSFLH